MVNHRGPLTAVAVLTLAVGGCGTDDSREPRSIESTGAVGQESGCDTPQGAAPTAEDLTAMIGDIVDVGLMAEEKDTLVEGEGGDDPELWTRLAEASAANPDIRYEVSAADNAVKQLDECTLTAEFSLYLSSDQAPGSGLLTFVAEDGVWKLSREDACGIATSFGIEAALCP
ncbi:hypothetical protein [Hoyosella altamirensis]|uniref:Low molecular weight antigen MTB12-like C-terminal domain-containing protein n=1 Tax=Hoyosella altamirensis TaxID=616997 RepID=A0A839RPU3_9ACTN|nr:hypothetical protein [Hoyosella altamirensis]MBB3038825.1 hypothetical protein [Hoyosella altamirensis]